MGFFRKQKAAYLQYEIHLTDPQQVKDLNASDKALIATAIAQGWNATWPNAVLQAPMDAAVMFSAPISDPNSRLSPTVTPVQNGPLTPPAITSAWFVSDANYPLDKTTFLRTSGGWFGLSFLFGTITRYFWVRKFVYDAGPGVSGSDGSSTAGVPGIVIPPPPTAIAKRRWIDGAELPPIGEGGTFSNPMAVTRDAARHPGGLGYAFRENVSTNARIHNSTEQLGGGQPTTAWERFYIRPRRLPTAASQFWRCHSTPSTSQGIALQLGPAGEVIVNSVDAFNTFAIHGSAGVLTLDTWARIDIQMTFGAGSVARFKIWINGGLPRMDVTSAPGLQGTAHTTSAIGYDVGVTNGLEFDADDWMQADLPTENPRDWFAGSRMQLVRVTGVASPGTWAGDWRNVLQTPDDTAVGATNVQSSSSALDTITYNLDTARTCDGLPGQRGVAAFLIARKNFSSAALAGRLGYTFAGAAAVLAAAANQITNYLFTTQLYAPAGVVVPPPMAGLTVTVEHANSAQTEKTAGVFLVAEVLGIFGPEDVPVGFADAATMPINELNGGNAIHNAPYPGSPWARTGIAAPAPFATVGGTYLGTGVPFDLKFAFPIHWLFIRPLTGVVDGVHWWSSMLASHPNVFEHVDPALIPDVLLDPDFAPAATVDAQETQTLVRILSDLQTNAAGVTYQYIAVSDAAIRCMLNGSFAHKDTVTNRDNALWTPTWKPEAGFFWGELVGQGATPRAYFKGLGHATRSGSPLTAAELADVGAFAPGVFNSGLNLTIPNGSVAYNFWRRDDLSGDPGLPRVVQLVSYIGDGTGARVIALTPASGRRPLYAMVVPHNADVAIYRDPSHTGTTSHKVNNVANAATGITAGAIDAITIGSALNVAGVSYDVFVLPGDTVAGNAGWSGNGTFVALEPGLPGDPGGDQMPDDMPPDVGTSTTATAPAELAGDLAANCTLATHKVINIALSRIGVTQQVAALGTDLTAEAVLGRLHYTEDVLATLRDFPWAFATRYVDPMTLVRGIVWGTTAVVQPWSSAVPYVPDDVVVLAGVNYYCIKAHTAVLPPSATYWSKTPPSDTRGAALDANDDWAYAYRVPTDLVLARRLVRAGFARRFDPNPPPFRIGQDANGNLLFTDERDAVLEYTTRPVCAAGAGDALFRDALSWRIAHSLSSGLAKDAKKRQECWQMYLHTLARAAVPDANEQQRQSNTGDASWIQDRDLGGDPWGRNG